MKQLATITSKRQLTIPVAIFDRMRFKKGERVLVFQRKETIVIRPVKNLVEELAGTISLPKRFKSFSLEKIIQRAKEEYFNRKK